MPVSVVVGGQYGSEGKGKVSEWLSNNDKSIKAIIRVGGPNSGHTSMDGTILRHLSKACLREDCHMVLGPGSYINPDVLINEIQMLGINPSKVLVDPKAWIISNSNIKDEKGLVDSIGSTGCGIGTALINRIRREQSRLAKYDKALWPCIKDTAPYLREILNNGDRVIIEGTQGFGLSLLHSEDYPYVTSRDTTAAGFVSEAGLSPIDVDRIYMVLRTYPIRVGGNSGPLKNEITWGKVSNNRIPYDSIEEYTSVTNKLRRVGLIDYELINRAIMINNPTHIVLNHLDYIEKTKDGSIGPNAKDYIERLEKAIDKHIDYIGLGKEDIQVW